MDKQLQIKEDLIVAMTKALVSMEESHLAIRNLLYKFDALETFLAGYQKTLERIECKIDTVSRQTIKVEKIDEGVEDYGK